MKFLITGRQKGKTTELVKWALQDPSHRAILVMNGTEMQRVYGLLKLAVPEEASVSDIPWVVTYQQAMDGKLWGTEVEEYGIDNVDLFLQQVFNRPVGLVTGTGEWETRLT